MPSIFGSNGTVHVVGTSGPCPSTGHRSAEAGGCATNRCQPAFDKPGVPRGRPLRERKRSQALRDDPFNCRDLSGRYREAPDDDGGGHYGGTGSIDEPR
jgi:hypothetical protein